jgi:outer membrane receptor protein involved in Fe transport
VNLSAFRHNPKIAAAIAIALGCSPQVFADAPSDEIEEVIVTASRREQNLLDVPYNISAVSGQALQEANITSLSDISRVLPGINIPNLGARANSSNSNIIIRGLNANDPDSSAYLPWSSVPLVSTYIDEVPLFVNMNLSDVQRVEVLRGPQGTLYGSGAVAGTIKVIHNAPDPSKFTLDITADGSDTEHATNGSYTLTGLMNLPLSDRAALRVSGGFTETAGFINASNAVVFGPNYQPVLLDPSSPLTSPLETQKLDGVDRSRSAYARASLLWHVTSAFDATLAYQHQDDNSNGFSRQTQGLSYTDAAYIPLAPDHRIVDLEALTLSDDLGFATVTSSTSFTRNHDASGYDESPFLLSYDADSPLFYGSFPRPITEFITQYTDSSFVEEMRLVSKVGEHWDYTVGGFFRHETNDVYQYEIIPGFTAWSQLPGSADAVNSVLGSNYANFGDYIQYYNGGTRPSALTPLDAMYTYNRDSDFTDTAFYGELTRHLTPVWDFTAGLRVFWQDVKQNLIQTIPFGGPYFSTLPYPENLTDAYGTTIANGDQKFHNHLIKLNTSYALSPALRTYATYSEGFRHGGANATAVGTCAFCDSPSTQSFRPDTVKNYELGLKGTAGKWLRFSGDVYVMKWYDMQIQLYNATDSAYVANGGTAVSQGLELEMEAELARGLSATFGYGYADAHVTGDFTITDRGETILAANDGDRLPYVPKQTMTGGLNYKHDLSGDKVLDTTINAAYHSDETTQINASAAGYQTLSGFTTVNASAGLLFGTQWSVRLYAINLLNELGISAAGPVLKNAPTYPNYLEQYIIRPRTIGVTFDFHPK